MPKAKVILALILAAIAIISTLAYSSATETFWFSKNLTVEKSDVGSASYYQPIFYYNITDSGKYLGTLYFRMEAVPPNRTSNEVYIDFQHVGNTRLDSIVFRFQSPEVTRVYVDMSDPVTVSYTSSRSINSYSVKAEFGKLGTMQGSDVYQFILYDFGAKSSNLYFTADISMHYMNPLELTALKAQVTLNTIIPSL